MIERAQEGGHEIVDGGTRPLNVPMSFRGFDQEAAEETASTLGYMLHEFGKIIDLSALDGMTVAFDYDDALTDLDRGYETVRVLTKTTEFGTGVAMTPAVLRDCVLKSHIVINAAVALMLKDEDKENANLAIHTIVHECAHVEITAAYEKCFPDELLKKRYDTILDCWRWDVIKACWDEYAACRIASNMVTIRFLATKKPSFWRTARPTEKYASLSEALAVAMRIFSSAQFSEPTEI